MMGAQQLIESPRNVRPHVVLLGAGASLASFPNGDAVGVPVPLMNDLVEKLKLQPLIDETGLRTGRESDFELLYGQLLSDKKYSPITKEIEGRIYEFFSNLSLPDRATIYDRLLISLRSTDAVFTFNWDPFLFDAYERNRTAVPLPEIFFLHGNVRIGACLDHSTWGAKHNRCPECHRTFSDVPLLYPIQRKNYSEDPYIRKSWDCARSLFKEAFTITIFGYGAPVSDAEACELLKRAWLTRSPREFEHIQVIDTACEALLYKRWSSFTPTFHFHAIKTFEESRIAHWPRRSGESLFYPMSEGRPCRDFPLPRTDKLSELQSCAANIARNEVVGSG